MRCVSPKNEIKLRKRKIKNYEIFSEKGIRLSTILNDSRESNFLFLIISVLIQRFNEVAPLRGTFQDIPDTEG